MSDYWTFLYSCQSYFAEYQGIHTLAYLLFINTVINKTLLSGEIFLGTYE